MSSRFLEGSLCGTKLWYIQDLAGCLKKARGLISNRACSFIFNISGDEAIKEVVDVPESIVLPICRLLLFFACMVRE